MIVKIVPNQIGNGEAVFCIRLSVSAVSTAFCIESTWEKSQLFNTAISPSEVVNFKL